MYVHTKHEGKGNHAKDIHLFHTYAIRDEVTGYHLPDDQPTAKVEDLPLTDLLPSAKDHAELRSSMVVLWSRVLVERMPAFHSLRKAIVWHIPHDYSEIMKTKSETVSATVEISVCTNLKNYDFQRQM